MTLNLTVASTLIGPIDNRAAADLSRLHHAELGSRPVTRPRRRIVKAFWAVRGRVWGRGGPAGGTAFPPG